MKGFVAAGVGLILGATSAAAQQAPAAAFNDYPTEARADFVFVCMAANGQTRDSLRRCSCAIDVIASILPYDRYVAAETVLSLRQVGGERTSVMRNAASANEAVQNLLRAQAEGDVRCF